MKILVIGSGGREHAICEKLNSSKNVEKIFALPGNAGIAEIAKLITDFKFDDHSKVVNFCLENKIDFVFVGPEQPLVEGLVDDLERNNIKSFGPSKFCAQLEGSKIFMKKIAIDNNIPTAKYEVFFEEKKAFDFAKSLGFPCVIKADGLAAGKGVVIPQNEEELTHTLKEFFAGKFGEASKKIVIEEFLTGVEVSYFALCDGENFISLGSACDHKKVGENETGPNTGGMGTFSPSPFVTKEIEDEIKNKMIAPTLRAMKNLGHPFKGILFAGIILTKDGPKLLEFNTRFGDPETQVILPRIKSDFAELVLAAIGGKLSETKVEFEQNEKYVCVVVASKGYPETATKDVEIDLSFAKNNDAEILHAGTAIKNGKLVSNGGRVLNIVAHANTFKEAREKAYQTIDQIRFAGGFARRDIAKKVEEL